MLSWTQPEPGSQLSTVHGLPSSQSLPSPPAHTPPAQLSPRTHSSPSSQPLPSSTGSTAQSPVSGAHSTFSQAPASNPSHSTTLSSGVKHRHFAGFASLLSHAGVPLQRSPSSGQSASE